MTTYTSQNAVDQAQPDTEVDRISVTCTRVTQLAAAASVYRGHGQMALAAMLTQQVADMIDDLPEVEQRILLLIAIGRGASYLDYDLHETCGRVHGPIDTCPAGGAS